MSENPYEIDNPYADSSLPAGVPFEKPHTAGYVSQVQVVAILLIIHGVLTALVGLLFVVMAVVMPAMMAGMAESDPGGPPPESMKWFVSALYGGMGLCGLLPGILQVVAGIANLRFRSRTLGMVALVLGIASSGVCYCAPTSIALAIYGLIVYLNEQVKLAFQMGQQGHTASQIMGHFYAK